MKNGEQVMHLANTDIGSIYVTKDNDLGMEKDGTFLEAKEEMAFMKKHVGVGTNFIDVGAHVGFFSIYAAQLGASYIHAYEPHPENYSNLTANYKLHSINGIPWNYAVGDIRGKHLLYESENNSGDHMVENCGPTHHALCSVHTVKLDDMLSHPHFIKMDIQGAEYRALKGLTNVIRKWRPIIMMEYSPWHLEAQGINGIDFLNYVHNHLRRMNNYKIECLSGDPYELESPKYATLYAIPL